jgi:hypothetical protein
MALAEIKPPMEFKAQSGVCGGALNVRRWRMRRMTARTGHAWRSPERPWPTVSPRTAFFWSVKMRMTKVAESRVAGDAVSRSIGMPWCQRRTSARVNGCGSFPVMVHLPGRSRKKKASQIRSAAPIESAVFCSRATTDGGLGLGWVGRGKVPSLVCGNR